MFADSRIGVYMIIGLAGAPPEMVENLALHGRSTPPFKTPGPG